MAKNDSAVKHPELDSEGLPFIPGFSDAGGVELDLGRAFFKPRTVPVHSIAQGFWWEIKEFPNFVNEDTGEIMRAGVMKLTKPAPVDVDGKVMIKEAGSEIYVPINYKLREIEPFARFVDVVHEMAIVTLDEKPLKGDAKRTMRGFRYRVIRANVPRLQAEQEAAPAKLKELMKGNTVAAPSLPARG